MLPPLLSPPVAGGGHGDAGGYGAQVRDHQGRGASRRETVPQARTLLLCKSPRWRWKTWGQRINCTPPSSSLT